MNIVVVGYFGKSNLGDNLFTEAFPKLFPEHTFAFTDMLTIDQVSKADAIFFGGGSYLDAPPFVKPEAIDKLIEKPILYIGVGAETNIHPGHKALLQKAKLVAIRSPKFLSKMKEINPNTIVIPDIVCSLGSKNNLKRIAKSLLFIPNVEVVPRWNDPHWKHSAFTSFKCEVAQVLDALVADKWMVRFLPLCTSDVKNDEWAATEIINAMDARGSTYRAGTVRNYDQFTSLVGNYELVITQRYHGIIGSELSLTPYIALAHHDKLFSGVMNSGTFLSYFETSKASLMNAIDKSNKQRVQVINQKVFDDLKSRVKTALA